MMLSELDLKNYQELKLQLENLEKFLVNFDNNRATIELNLMEIKKIIDQKILLLDQEKIEVKFRGKWQSIQTEINRSYRLLLNDWLFLKTALQPMVIEKRLKLFKHNLTQLISFCNFILEVNQF